MSGKFIVFEGVDGAGKTTQIKLLHKKLTDMGHDCIMTYEPGDNSVGRSVREFLIERDLDAVSEALLFAFDRAVHIREIVRPAIGEGKIVLCDRFLMSSLVYQGIARGLGEEWINEINSKGLGGLVPDVTLVFDIAVDMALKRVQNANRFENTSLQEKVREGFIKKSGETPNTFLIEAGRSEEEVFLSVWEKVSWLLKEEK